MERRRWVGWGVAVVAGLLLAVLGSVIFAPVPANADPARFSAMRALIDIRRIAAAPHPIGSPENARVRRYLRGRLEGLGLAVAEQRSRIDASGREVLESWGLGDGPAPVAVSLVAVLPGRDRALPAVLLMAHLDTVAGSPGAPDDSTGVAAILETLRALPAGGAGPPARDVMVLLTDGEEIGLEGAEAFFARNPLRRRVGAVLNFESRGGGGRTTLFETSAHNGAAVARYAGAVRRPAGSSLSVFVYRQLPNNTDLSAALGMSYIAYNFAYIGKAAQYHSPLATPERLDLGTVQDMGDQALDLTRALAVAAPLPIAQTDVVFFDLFGFVMPHYPGWVGWPMLGVAAAAFLFAAGQVRFRGVAGGAGRMAGFALIALLAMAGLNLVSGVLGAVNYYDRLAALPRLEAMVLCAGLAGFVALYRRAAEPGALAGAGLLLVAAGAAAQLAAPTAAYVIVAPAMLAGLGALATGAGRIGRAIAVVPAALVTGYMLQIGHLLVQAVGPFFPFVAIVPLTPAVLAWLPLWPGLPVPAARIVTATLLVTGLALALWILLDPLAASVPAYSIEA